MKKNTTIALVSLFTVLLSAQNLPINSILEKYENNMQNSTSIIKAQISTTDSFGTTTQSFEIYSRENGDTLIVIADGPDKGQKILRLENSLFLFYPAAEEVIRLTGSALKENIAGTDFSYEDLSGDNSIANNYTTVLKGTETVDNRNCYVIELTAKKKMLAYQKQTLYIDMENFTAVKTIVYSASGKALREIISSNITETSGKYIAMNTVVTDLLKKNSRTTMKILTIKLNEDIPSKYFTREGLTW